MNLYQIIFVFLNILAMSLIKKLEGALFQRMQKLQQTKMQSRLMFILAQIARCIFRGIFMLMIFLVPISMFNTLASRLFATAQAYSLLISLSIIIFFIGFALVFCFYHKILQGRSMVMIQIFFPWVDILALVIVAVCVYITYKSLNSGNMGLIICNIMNLVAVCITQIIYNIFNFSKAPRSKNYLHKRQARSVVIADLLSICLCFYLSIKFSSAGHFSQTQLSVYSLVHLCFTVAKIKQKIYLKFYLDSVSNKISGIFYFVELNLGILVLIANLMQLPFIYDNILVLVIIMTCLGYFSLEAYISRRDRHMYLSSASELKDQGQTVVYLNCLCQLAHKVEIEQEDIILISLKRQHLMKCEKAQCYCHTTRELHEFVQEYVKSELVSMTQIFHNSPNILIQILYFKMVMFNYYPQILSRLTYYNSYFTLTLTQRYYRYCLSQQVSKFINKRNLQISAVDSEDMFKLEQIRLEIQTIIKNQIDIRSKMWKYISRGLCRISQLQHNCNAQLTSIHRLTTIYNQYKIKFKKSKEFNLLLLFYFGKVSFLNNGREIRENIKQIYYGYKEEELYEIKEFKKFIYHKGSCAIETIVDNKAMGIITGATENIQDLFGFTSSKVIGLSINHLMPKFMAQQHELIMSSWAQSGTWRTIGKLKEIYCIHKDRYCFSALIYLKLYIKDNSLYFITNIFKLNDNDYLVINSSMKIQGLGKRFMKILGQSAKQINAELLIEGINSMLSTEKYIEGRTYRKVFYSLVNMESEVERYHKALRFTDKQNHQANQQFYNMLKRRCQQKHEVQFTVKKYKMGNIFFLVINLRQSKKIQSQATNNFIDYNAINIVMRDTSRQLQLSERESRQPSSDAQEEALIIGQQNSSLASTTEKQSYPLTKIIQKFLQFLQEPSHISDQKLIKFNCFIILMLLILSSINFLTFYGYQQILFQIEGIFFADGGVSDIMQTTQIAYNHIYVLKSQLINSSVANFNSTLQSAKIIQSYVYQLKQFSFTHLISDVSEFTHFRLYQYIAQPAKWKSKNSTIVIETYQFLQNYYYLTNQVIQQLTKLKNSNSTKMDYSYLNLLIDNFPKMQILNQYFLDYYQKMTDSSHSILNYISIVSMIVYFIVSLFLGLAVNHYFKFRFNQTIDSFTFLSFIPNQYLQKMKDYYSNLMSNVVQTDKLKYIQDNEEQIFAIDTYDLFHKSQNTRTNLSSKIRFINYEGYYKWIFILLIVVIANAINYVGTLQIRNFFTTSEAIIFQINALMQSENKILQSYFDLKASYYVNSSNNFNQNLYTKLSVFMDQGEVTFNAIADQLTSRFTQYDSTFQPIFVNSLVSNICQLTAGVLTPFQNQKCVKNLTLGILQGGILISMNFFQRNLRQALQDLNKQLIVKSRAQYNGDYFQQLNFVEIDKMLIYMFKIYQLTQAIVFNSYVNTIYLITGNYLQISVGVTIFFLLVLLIWVQTIPSQKKELSKLYGHMLLVPSMILRTNRRIVSHLKQVLEYSDS